MFRQHRLPLLLILLPVLIAAGIAILPRTIAAVDPDPIAAAWEKARAAGSYHFDSNVTQITIPVANVTNIGRSSRTEQLHLSGDTNLRQNRLEMQIWAAGGSLVQGTGSAAIKVEDGKSYVRTSAGEWQAQPGVADGLAPQGDFLAYLQAVRDVAAHAPESRAGITFTRYSFTLDGPTFAAYVRARMEEAMRARGELPAAVSLEAPRYYRDMTGDGELWVGEDGLPLRQILNLSFPEQNGEFVDAQIVVDFSRFGADIVVPATAASAPAWLAQLGLHAEDFGIVLAFAAMIGLAGALIYFRRARLLQTSLSLAVILSIVVGPLLSTLQIDAFYASQAAQAASQEAQQSLATAQSDVSAALGAVEFNPHTNPAESAGGAGPGLNGGDNLRSPEPAIAQSLTLQAIDPGTNSDADALTDFIENRAGTDPLNPDTDQDGVNDAVEVLGFQMGGQQWYGDARALDSNNDGLPDGSEWDANGNGQPDDNDGDSVPDLFDTDNDGDGVPDRQDLSPFSRGASTYTNAAPLRATFNNLTAGRPVLVDFQVRPTDVSRLWYAFNVLDWPSNDEAGQVQDVDGRTYADLAVAQGRGVQPNDSHGDMKLIPMLEIRVSGAVTNLPAQSDLTAYNISVNNLSADGSQKVIYVPLSIITAEDSGQRVAFSGRMRYQPSGTWPTPHDIRLAWVVQTLVDVPCDVDNPADVAAGCVDGYILNAPQVIQSYYDDWTLTGLNVSEQHGAKTALIYEDPAVDGDLDDDYALTALTIGLDNSFLAGRDANNDSLRDVDIDEIARRFNHVDNTTVSSIERWGLTGALNVLSVERHDYDSFDQATIFTAMTDTVGVLANRFNPAWTANNALKPTIAFAYEQASRSLGLDVIRANADYISQSGANLTVDMDPANQPPAPLNTMVGLKWTRYCRPDSGSSWAACSGIENWNELERRYANLPLADDLPGADIAAGSNAILQIYDMTLSRGIDAVVLTNGQLVDDPIPYKTDSETSSDVQNGLTFGAAGVKKLANLVIMDLYLNQAGVKAQIGATFTEFVEGSTSRGLIRALKNWRMDPVQATKVSLLAGATLAGVAVGAYYLNDAASNGNQDAAIALDVLIATVQTYASLIDPLLTVARWARGGNSVAYILSANSEAIGTSRMSNAIGAVIAISIVWGFFIYNVTSNDISTGSIEFGAALAQAIATTIYIIVLTIISSTVIGLILVGIVTVIDVILTLVCELGGGSCFTIGGAVIKALADTFYTYGVFIDTDRADLVQPGSPNTTLTDPNSGFVAGNGLTVSLPITTHIVQKKPNSNIINDYGWMLNDSLRATTFRYSLTQPGPQDVAAPRNSMSSEWGNVQMVERGNKYILYSATANSTPAVGFNLQPGLNRPATFYLNMGYAVPAYDCWRIYVPWFVYPFYKQIPFCGEKTLDGGNSSQISSLIYDIFPGTLGGFVSTTARPGGGRALDWDAAFPVLKDADGDGLRSSQTGGLDPNDTLWDTDNDGLPDAFEVERRAAGMPYSPIQCDSDGDGLTDAQEELLRSNPANVDSDNDGLRDAVEIWHPVYNTSTCQPTGAWSGGWNVTLDANTSTIVRASADPTVADTDGDGVSDLAEFQLLGQLDSQDRPYHPGVVNAPPVAIYTETNSPYVAPGGNVTYTTRVVASQPLDPGVLTVSAPVHLGGVNVSSVLGFNPLTFILDRQLPSVSVDPSTLTDADTWAAGSGVLRFNGTATDSIGLAAVQIREGNGDFVDVTFGGGLWQTALPVDDPEGRLLNITVRAVDLAGRVSEVTQPLGADLSSPTAPDTTINAGPANPSTLNTALFEFSGSVNAVAFECQIDAGVFAACVSPFSVDNLSKGDHVFRVRAVDATGNVDLTPASFAWTINGGALDATITGSPANPSPTRDATFTFSGTGNSFECSLDGASFAACSSAQSYTALTYGSHTFLVRARNNLGETGTAAQYTWTVLNSAPVAANQTLTTDESVSLAITLSAVDGDALSYRVVNAPANGVLLGAAAALTYVPNTGFSGEDSFTFRANDGQLDSNLATVTITVEPGIVNLPPDTTITAQPADPSGQDVSFSFGGSDDVGVARFECSLDGASFATCSSPQAYTALTAGQHTFQVRAVDAANLVDPSPATYTWTVQVAPGVLVGACGPYTVYRTPQGQLVAPGWSGAIRVGSASANTINGNSGRDLILGLGGNDALDGKGGDDVLCGGDGVDLLTAAAGNDFLDGGNAADVLNGGAGDFDELLAGAGNDVLLDGDGALRVEGGAGDDVISISLRNGWRTPSGQRRFTGLAAGYGNDAVGLAILNLAVFTINITGDERDNPPSPLEGNADALSLVAILDPASQIIKFEQEVTAAALEDLNTISYEGFPVDPTTLADESGAAFLSEPVGGDGSDSGEMMIPVYLPLLSR